MPAKSKSQQRFFGMVDAYKKGELDNASPEVKKAADSMSMKEVRKFAKTKRKGLPNHVKKAKNENVERDIAKRILHEQLMKLVCEEETPVATESNGTYIYTAFSPDYDNNYVDIFIHTQQDFNNDEYLDFHEILDADFVFNIDELAIIYPRRFYCDELAASIIIPPKIGDALMVEMKKYNEDTIRRNKVLNMLKTTCIKTGRDIPYN